MTWKPSKAISQRCSGALAWCRGLAGQFDGKKLKRVDWAVSAYKNVVGWGLTKSTYGVPHTIVVYLNTACNGGDLMWVTRSVRVTADPSADDRAAAEKKIRELMLPGELMGEMRILGKRVVCELWSRYYAPSLDVAAVWIFGHELWHFLCGTRQVKGANTEQNACAAGSWLSDMYQRSATPKDAALFLRASAHNIGQLERE